MTESPIYRGASSEYETSPLHLLATGRHVSLINGRNLLFTGKYYLTPGQTGFLRKKPEPFAFFGTRVHRTDEQTLFIDQIEYNCLQPIKFLENRAGYVPHGHVKFKT